MSSKETVARLRAELADRPLRPYDRLSDTLQGESLATGERALATGVLEMRGVPLPLTGPVDWTGAGLTRSLRLSLQALDALEPLLVVHRERGDPRALAEARRLAEEALRALASPPPAEGLESFAEHPVVRASQLYRLAYIFDAIARDSAVADADLTGLLFHLLVAADDVHRGEGYLDRHNHGMRVALMQIAGASRFVTFDGSRNRLAGVPGLEEVYWQGLRRLAHTLGEHVAGDGVHKEHSPAYQLVTARRLYHAIEAGWLDDAQLHAVCRSMRRALDWMRTPDGRVVNFGDGHLEPAPEDLAALCLPAEAEAGRRSEAVDTRLFAEGGYWFARAGTGAGAFYLAQSAAFHSRTHKQADTGTFIWHDRGLPILVDAGRYDYGGRTEPGSALFKDGFWYADPRRVHVESTRAHNTVELDGRNHPRYRQTPFGSSLHAEARAGDVVAALSSVPNLPRCRHVRLLVARPGEWLLCLDALLARDGAEHDFRHRFLLHPDWHVAEPAPAETPEGGRGGVVLAHSRGERLHLTPAWEGQRLETCARGLEQDGRPLAGWWSPRSLVLEPAPSPTMARRGGDGVLATLLTFRPVEVDVAWGTANPSHRNIRLRWRDAGGTTTLRLQRVLAEGGGQQLRLEHGHEAAPTS